MDGGSGPRYQDTHVHVQDVSVRSATAWENFSVDGKIKRPAMVEAVKIARRNAFRSKLMRQSRREI